MRAIISSSEPDSYEWLVERIPYVTASAVADIMAKGQGVSRRNYMSRKLCELATGVPTKTFRSQKMQDGNDREETARQLYVQITGAEVVKRPFAYLVDERLGASIDGDVVGTDGLVEYKNVMSAEQIDLLSTGKIKDRYVKQMQTQMYVLGKQWNDFTSVALGDEESGELPNHLKVKIIRVYRDETAIHEIRKGVASFWRDLDALMRKLGVVRGKV